MFSVFQYSALIFLCVLCYVDQVSANPTGNKEDLLELMKEGGKTKTVEINVQEIKETLHANDTERRKTREVKYGLEKNVKPMKCELKKYNNVKYLGTLTGVAENIESEDICGGICFQFNFEGGLCKSANYLKKTQKCELMSDLFDPTGPMAKFIEFYIEKSRTTLYTVPVSCKSDGKPKPTPAPTGTTKASFNGTINLAGGCGKTYFPNRVTMSASRVPSTRIVGGTEARPHSMPWIVSIQEMEAPFCGGSLIRCSDKDESPLLITAAHCIKQPDRWSDLNPDDVTANFGEHSLNNRDQGQQQIEAKTFEIHSEYDEGTSANDIAVIQLKEPVKFSQTIQPVCLPTTNDTLPPAGSKCIVAGWGTTSEGGKQSDKLMQIVAPILSDADCSKPEFYGAQFDTKKMFCAGYKEGQKDSCQGDSGGPYVCYNGDSATLMGVVSFGFGCARESKPGVYSRVINFLPWIEEKKKQYCTVE